MLFLLYLQNVSVAKEREAMGCGQKNKKALGQWAGALVFPSINADYELNSWGPDSLADSVRRHGKVIGNLLAPQCISECQNFWKHFAMCLNGLLSFVSFFREESRRES